MASNYITTLDDYKSITLLPSSYVDDVETSSPGWIVAQCGSVSSLDVDARLRKRYGVPFQTPFPPAVQAWVARIVDPRVLVKRGVDPQDPQFQWFLGEADLARRQIEEAANSETSLFDLPVSDTINASAISAGRPLVATISSPYEAVYRRDARARDDDGGC